MEVGRVQMSTRIPALLASALLVAPLATQAQTLDFYDSVSGTSTTLLNGTLGPPGSISLESVPFSGSVTGSIILSGSSATFDFTLNELGGGGAGINAVNQFSMSGEFSAAGSGYYFGTTDNAMGDIQILTNSRGAITGATVDLTGDEYGTATQSQLTIVATGVTGAYQGFIPPSTGYACTAAPLTFSGTYPNGIYTG